jgi:hypothetical protein
MAQINFLAKGEGVPFPSKALDSGADLMQLGGELSYATISTFLHVRSQAPLLPVGESKEYQ